ncbi:GTP-binding protein [Bacillus sp. B15-48]|nr:GTP-binding protein [Bacillus sp. B15-48]
MKFFTLTKDNGRWVISRIENASPDQFIAKEMKKVDVKGLYLSAPNANDDTRFHHFVELLTETELNALVIDVKEDEGRVTYHSDIPLVKEVDSDHHPYLPKIDERLKTLKENNIYSIARIVVFKDPYLAQKKPELAIKKKDGNLYYSHNIPWVDPYKKEVWDYVIDLAKEAARKGFDEIQFDYVRFPENAAKYNPIVQFDNPEGKTKAEVISEFLTYATEQLRPYGVFVSADVFGIATSDPTDSGIGQQWEMLNPTVDVLSPMIYPSHYANGSFGIPVPDAQPYSLIKQSLKVAQERNDALKEKEPNTAIADIRPWLQDFTATWVNGHIRYGAEQVKAQIQAANDLGINEYLIWNPANNYSERAWRE